MLQVDCFYFFKLGHHVHPLTTISAGVPLQDVWVPLYLAKSELNSFFQVFPLKTSRAPGTALYQAISAVIPADVTQIRTTNADDSPRTLDYTEARAINEAANEFEAVLKAELNGWDAFFVSQKGGYSTTDLISRAENILPESAHGFLSPEAIEDLREAGRCLAFNLGTAASFHMVRATETFIWKYYKAVIGHLPPIKMRNWGAYSKNLSKCGNADSRVLRWMDQIRDEYRNPVLHPDRVVPPDEALEFVYACISLMMAISRALSKGPEEAEV